MPQTSLQELIIPRFHVETDKEANSRSEWDPHHQPTVIVYAIVASQKMYLSHRNYRFSHTSKKPHCVFHLQSQRIHHFTNTLTCVKAVQYPRRRSTHSRTTPTSSEKVNIYRLLPTSTQLRLSTNLMTARWDKRSTFPHIQVILASVILKEISVLVVKHSSSRTSFIRFCSNRKLYYQRLARIRVT